MNPIRRGLVITSGMLAGALVFAQGAFAQGCALCYNDAAATGSQGITALRHGILILAIPPMLIFAALFAILYKRRDLHHEVASAVSVAVSGRTASEFVLHLE